MAFHAGDECTSSGTPRRAFPTALSSHFHPPTPRYHHDYKTVPDREQPQRGDLSRRRRGHRETICLARAAPAPVPSPAPNPAPAPPAPVVPPAAIAQQKAKLKLSDGRTATFWFAASGSSLQCTAAIGLDQVLSYELVPAEDPAPVPAPAPDPIPTPIPTPIPNPTPTPAPTPQATSNLRVLFLYDPLTLIDMSPDRQAILGSPALRRISTSTARRNTAARPKYAP